MTKPPDYPCQPEQLFEHFYQISQLPRPSGEEAALREHIVQLAAEHNSTTAQDAIGNLVVYVPGSTGREAEPALIIQNHLDMVTVKTDDKEHDFSTDPLTLKVEQGWLLADRTTLGADNGVGCAAALALMTDDAVSHPPLELLFTVEEETGLYGASDLEAGLLSGQRMLNLDTEDWGELYVGCAGGRGWILRRPLSWEEADEALEYWRLDVRGLAGGHSGIQIHQQLGNAIKLLGQWLAETADLDLRVASFQGGVAHNVIPREASLVFASSPGSKAKLDGICHRLQQRWASYLPAADSELSLQLISAPPGALLERPDQQMLQQVLLMFPHGAISYNQAQPADLVDLSINMAVLRVNETGLYLESTLRYFNSEEALALEQQVRAIAQWLQAEIEDTVDYPGWQPDFDSELLARAQNCYRESYGEDAAIKAIHAGLECGILKSKKPDTDIISFGPTIRGAHSPRERLEIATVEPFWKLLVSLLKDL